ncbi:MAG TPA: hypothetical protein PKK11_04445 [Methanothrix sp.]|nr:hypothetical protein [Methanothrix sp.]HPT18799.1 hypothetical protein [Methanothrix sp.]
MPDSKDVRSRICELLDMDDEQLLAELKRSLDSSDECHQRIDDDLQEMMQEVDRLLYVAEAMDYEPLQDEDETSGMAPGEDSGQR